VVFRQLAPLLLTTLIWACTDDPIEASAFEYGIDSREAIAGSAVEITSDLFRYVAEPKVTMDTFDLAVTRLNDTTISAVVPRQARGVYALKVDGYEIAHVRVFGFVSFTARTNDLVGNGYAFVDAGAVSLIYGTADKRIVQFFPGTASQRTILNDYLIDNGFVRSAGPTPDPSVVLFSPFGRNPANPWNNPVEAWRVGTIPVQVGGYPIDNGRVIAAFNDSVVFRGFHHDVETRKLRAGKFVIAYWGQYEETNEVVISPRGDRAAIRVHGSPTGPPVFNTASGDTAYHLRQFRGAEAVRFSATGDTLYMIGYNSQEQSTLVAVKASNGQQLMERPLPEWVEDMTYDPEAGILYLLAIEGNTLHAVPPGVLHVSVIDAKTFTTLGDMSTGTPGTYACWYKNPAVGPDGVFYVCGGDVWRFDKAPAGLVP
jgi:hypothetical protein